MSNRLHHFVHNLDRSAILTIVGIILLFSTSICVILIAPRYVDPTWTQPTSSYQVQMYEIADPRFYISATIPGTSERHAIYHLLQDNTLLAFQESDALRIVAPPHLEKYISRLGDPTLKLTSDLYLLRRPESTETGNDFNAVESAALLHKGIQEEWKKRYPAGESEENSALSYDILELYAPGGKEAFSLAPSDSLLENWVDRDYVILDETPRQPYHRDVGVIYINNPQEYRLTPYKFGNQVGWNYNPKGEKLHSLEQLKKHSLGFTSRQELIQMGEHIYAIEGCWYCHTDQTRTLVQDVVLNGSADYPAPPSSANEYIYQNITFPGTRRIGPDLSRVGIKRPSRDWHRAHFWSPQTSSAGSIMPPFQHFFDNDPRGTGKNRMGIPNYRFEAIFQYLMTKGTRITSPNQAWWTGNDPIKTKEIIEGQRKIR